MLLLCNSAVLTSASTCTNETCFQTASCFFLLQEFELRQRKLPFEVCLDSNILFHSFIRMKKCYICFDKYGKLITDEGRRLQ